MWVLCKCGFCKFGSGVNVENVNLGCHHYYQHHPLNEWFRSGGNASASIAGLNQELLLPEQLPLVPDGSTP